jgi:AmmeMemoRadiSam system protein A
MPSLFEARPSPARPLTAAEQQELLQYARAAIVQAVCCGDLPRVLRHDGIFAEHCGVFVTLHLLQRLRGCIGVIETEEHLGSSLVRCAASAALADPRFPPVRQEELSALHIEISLLSAPEPIQPEQIEIGRHGLLVVSSPTRSHVDREGCEGPAFPSSGAPPFVSKSESSGASVKRGLLLPQVAVEHHFTVEQFLAETCRKADLPPDAWRNAAAPDPFRSSGAPPMVDKGGSAMTVPREATSAIQLFAFTCQIFSEAETAER